MSLEYIGIKYSVIVIFKSLVFSLRVVICLCIQALDKCRESPPIDWPAAAYILLGREDLALSSLARSNKSKEFKTQTNVNLISMSTPYMLHLHPVTIPSTVSDTIGLDGTKFEDTDSVDGSMIDGMEHIFSSSTQFRYGRDLRLNEVIFSSLC